MMARRSFPEIVHQILQLEGRKQTHIMYGTGLTYPQALRYLEALIERGLMKIQIDESGKKVYSLTDRGRVLMEHLNVVMEYLGREPSRV